jgi:hypothetical protein
MAFFVLLDAGFAVLVIVELESTYHEPAVRYSIGFGELWVLMGGIVCWMWAWQKHVIRRERFNLAVEIFVGLDQAMISFVNEMSATPSIRHPKIFSNREEFIQCTLVSICLTSQLLLWQLISHGENPAVINSIIENNPCAVVREEFKAKYNPQERRLVSLSMVNIIKAWIIGVRMANGATLGMLLTSCTTCLDKADFRINMLITNYHRAISRIIDIVFMVFVVIYIIGMPFLLWASEGYWGIGTNVFAFIVVIVPFSYSWFVEDIFQRPSGYYATVIYGCVYNIHKNILKVYQRGNVLETLLTKHFGEVLAIGNAT